MSILRTSEHGRWQAAILAVRLVLVFQGVLLYGRIHGFAPLWQFVVYLLGMMLFLYLQGHARPDIRRQAAALFGLLLYVTIMPIVATGHWKHLVFAGGMLLPIALIFAGLYFAWSRSGTPRSKP